MRLCSVILAVSIGAFGLSGCSGNVFSLEVGDCFNIPGGPNSEMDNVDRVSCRDLHEFEVYGTFDLTGSSWPGQSTVSRRADEGCVSRFASFVGIGYDDSEWYLWHMTPTQDSWDRGDDREVICSVTPEYGKTTGSARGTRR